MKIIEDFTPPDLLNIILADDDKDDCFLFEEALKEWNIPANIATVPNGVQLMHLRCKQDSQAYDVLFLDLNMPQKNGFACLEKIKINIHLKQLSLIIMSTSCLDDNVDLLYENGANFCIRKPSSFMQLKNVIQQAIVLTANKSMLQSLREKFIICSKMELNKLT